MDKRINIKNRERVLERRKESEFSGITNNWLFKLSAIVGSVIIMTSVINSITIMTQKLEILKQAEREVEELRLTNLHLSIEIKDMSTDRYLEKEARDRLNFGGQGEVAFVIPSNALDSAKEEVNRVVTPSQESIYETGNNVDEWISFLLMGV